MLWNGHERRRYGGMNDDEFESIAERAAEIARPLCVQDIKDDIFAEIGKTLVKRLLLVFGLALSAALLVWAKLKLGISFIGMKGD